MIEDLDDKPIRSSQDGLSLRQKLRSNEKRRSNFL